MPARGDLITKRKDGRYMARYTVQTPDGPKRKTIYGRAYKEVETALAKARGDAARGSFSTRPTSRSGIGRTGGSAMRLPTPCGR
jgi:hypothetical protein